MIATSESWNKIRLISKFQRRRVFGPAATFSVLNAVISLQINHRTVCRNIFGTLFKHALRNVKKNKRKVLN